MKVMVRLVMVLLLWCVHLSLAYGDEAQAAEHPRSTINNRQVKWTLSTFGLGWMLTGASKKQAMTVTAADTKRLVKDLDDTECFVVAHILLIQIHGLEEKDLPNLKDDMPDDNIEFISGMRIDFTNQDAPIYNSKDRHMLKKYWETRLRL